MSWQQLQDMLRQNRETRAAEQAEKLAACPICGDLLEERKGILNCPTGDYRKLI